MSAETLGPAGVSRPKPIASDSTWFGNPTGTLVGRFAGFLMALMNAPQNRMYGRTAGGPSARPGARDRLRPRHRAQDAGRACERRFRCRDRTVRPNDPGRHTPQSRLYSTRTSRTQAWDGLRHSLRRQPLRQGMHREHDLFLARART